MKKIKNIYMLLLSATLLLTACHQKTMTKNYGVSGVVINGLDQSVWSADEVVPSQTELIDNLENRGFTIREFDTAFESDIVANRVYAEKNNLFMDICYGLSIEDAKKIFKNYEAEYSEFYVLAQNEEYVYVVSDKKTFKEAGFESTATIGTIYMWE